MKKFVVGRDEARLVGVLHVFPTLPSEVSEWDTGDVCQWFEELGLEEYQESIQANEITGKELVDLHRADMMVSERYGSEQGKVYSSE